MRVSLIMVCVCGVGLCLASCGTPDQHTTKGQSPLLGVSETPIQAFRVAYEHDGLTVYSGGEPTSYGALEYLASLGVTTVISVDATTPEADAIEVLGMRSVHVPMSYSGVPMDCQSAVAKAIRQSIGSVFVHCHHGLHRGPTAAAAGLIALGFMSPAEGFESMLDAGTSEAYEKLYRDIAYATTLDDEVIEKAQLVRIAEVRELAAQMTEVDRIFENLKLLAENNWEAPRDHPDLSALSEAGQMNDLFRKIYGNLHIAHLAPLEVLERETAEFERYASAFMAAQDLEYAVVAGSSAQAHLQLEVLGNHCVDCHNTYR